MLNFRKKRREEESINPTPLVDVMFNLLIFIVITAQYTQVQSLKVNLPKAQSGAAIEERESVVITLTRDEKLFLNQDLMTFDQLKEKLVRFAHQTEPPSILLQADEGSTTGKLVQVMDIASQVGLKKISIETRKQK